jgi:hypothetical protein
VEEEVQVVLRLLAEREDSAQLAQAESDLGVEVLVEDFVALEVLPITAKSILSSNT